MFGHVWGLKYRNILPPSTPDGLGSGNAGCDGPQSPVPALPVDGQYPLGYLSDLVILLLIGSWM